MSFKIINKCYKITSKKIELIPSRVWTVKVLIIFNPVPSILLLYSNFQNVNKHWIKSLRIVLQRLDKSFKSWQLVGERNLIV